MRQNQGSAQSLSVAFPRPSYSMAFLFFIAFCCLSLWSLEASASNLKADITIANNYLFRGLTQTQDQAVVQGNIQYHHPSGISVGLKISNVDFRPGAGPKRKAVYTDNENIYSIIYRKNVSAVGFEIGATNYEYPSGGGPRFSEFNGGILYRNFRLGLNYDEEHENLYSEIAYAADINETLSWRAHAGYYEFKDSAALRRVRNFNNYADMSIGIRKKLSSGFVWGLDFTETSLDTNYSDEYSRFVISLNKAFDLLDALQ